MNIKASGAKSWVFRGTIGGRRTNKGLGPVALISLAEARIKALEIRRAIFDGNDPFANRRAAAPSFAKAADRVIAFMRPTWTDARSEQQWRASLDTYAGSLANRPVNAITTAHVLAVLEPIWTDKRETARRVRQRISAVLKWAVAQGFRADNPAGEVLDSVLPKPCSAAPRHHEALPYADVPAALVKARGCAAPPVAKLAFEFLALTAARSAEVREATWDEIDLDNRTWTISPERMKVRREHRVPLSARAMEILVEAREYRDAAHGDLVFPGAKVGRPMTAAAFGKIMHGQAGTPHGLRASFRNWVAQQTDTPRAVCEAALAHTIKNRTEAAYNRTDLFDRRRALMDQWAAYLAAYPPPSPTAESGASFTGRAFLVVGRADVAPTAPERAGLVEGSPTPPRLRARRADFTDIRYARRRRYRIPP